MRDELASLNNDFKQRIHNGMAEVHRMQVEKISLSEINKTLRRGARRLIAEKKSLYIQHKKQGHCHFLKQQRNKSSDFLLALNLKNVGVASKLLKFGLKFCACETCELCLLAKDNVWSERVEQILLINKASDFLQH